MNRWLKLFVLPLIFIASMARADYQDRFELGFGFAASSSQTTFSVGAEYEHRLDEIWGLGVTADYIFNDPGMFLLAIPNVYLHPTGGDWLVSAAPLVELTGGSTAVGVRFGTRVPIPIGRIVLIPEASIGLIANGPITTLGLGIGF